MVKVERETELTWT